MIAAPLYLLCLMLEQLNVLARGLAGYGIARALGGIGRDRLVSGRRGGVAAPGAVVGDVPGGGTRRMGPLLGVGSPKAKPTRKGGRQSGVRKPPKARCPNSDGLVRHRRSRTQRSDAGEDDLHPQRDHRSPVDGSSAGPRVRTHRHAHRRHPARPRATAASR